MYKQNLALNNLQELIYHKSQASNQTINQPKKREDTMKNGDRKKERQDGNLIIQQIFRFGIRVNGYIGIV